MSAAPILLFASGKAQRTVHIVMVCLRCTKLWKVKIISSKNTYMTNTWILMPLAVSRTGSVISCFALALADRIDLAVTHDDTETHRRCRKFDTDIDTNTSFSAVANVRH